MQDYVDIIEIKSFIKKAYSLDKDIKVTWTLEDQLNSHFRTLPTRQGSQKCSARPMTNSKRLPAAARALIVLLL